ncbi:MAG TPA: flagellar biosynthesis protein FlhB [Holophagaceae bacterium]|nr:flagellar biosynthesis protein FlhB [Holophagaceae bacterium]
MAEPGRTEQATPKRRQRARDEGSVAKSADFDAAILLWGNLFLFVALGGGTLLALGREMAYFLGLARPGALAEARQGLILLEIMRILARTLAPFLFTNLLIALAGGFLQRGFSLNMKPLTPKFDRLNPAQGFKKLFSARSMVELLKSLLKLLLLGFVAWRTVSPKIPALLETSRMALPQAMELLQIALYLLYRNILIAMLVIAVADFFYQRHAFEESIKMTKQEVKDEAKDSDGNPLIKGHQRSLMMAAARGRMLAEVPKATVIVTNPTHVAVALQYDEKTAAPVCLAKGLDHLALKIREKAKESGVTILERPELARALYRQVDVGKPIPGELYQAVAQVIAFVYRLKGAA